MSAWSHHHQKLRETSLFSTMIAMFANQIYWAFYYVDIQMIEEQYQSKFEEEYFYTKKTRPGKAYIERDLKFNTIDNLI